MRRYQYILLAMGLLLYFFSRVAPPRRPILGIVAIVLILLAILPADKPRGA